MTEVVASSFPIVSSPVWQCMLRGVAFRVLLLFTGYLTGSTPKSPATSSSLSRD